MVTVKIYDDGKLVREMSGDFTVCITASDIGTEDIQLNQNAVYGNFSLRTLSDTLSLNATRMLARICRMTGRGMDRASELIAGFIAKALDNSAKNILDAYTED